MRFQPSATDKARLNQKYRFEEKEEFVNHLRHKTRQRKRLPRSSYAFAQESGWGTLITSGRMKVKDPAACAVARSSYDVNVRSIDRSAFEL